MYCHVSFGKWGGFSYRVILYSFHSHAADTTRKSNDSREKTILAVLAPSIAFLWFLISLFAYLWFKKRSKKGTELQVNSTSTELEYFKLSTLTAATNNFSPANNSGKVVLALFIRLSFLHLAKN